MAAQPFLRDCGGRACRQHGGVVGTGRQTDDMGVVAEGQTICSLQFVEWSSQEGILSVHLQQLAHQTLAVGSRACHEQRCERGDADDVHRWLAGCPLEGPHHLVMHASLIEAQATKALEEQALSGAISRVEVVCMIGRKRRPFADFGCAPNHPIAVDGSSLYSRHESLTTI